MDYYSKKYMECPHAMQYFDFKNKKVDFMTVTGIVHDSFNDIAIRIPPWYPFCKEAMIQHMLMMHQDAPVYAMGKEFFETLISVDLKISAKNMIHWEERSFFIDFPRMIRRRQGEYIKGSYVSVMKNIPVVNGERKDAMSVVDRLPLGAKKYIKDYVMCVAPLYNRLGQLTNRWTIAAWQYDANDQETIEGYMHGPNNKVDDDVKEFMSAVFKSLVYIHSGDPDLRHLQVKKPHKSRDAKWYERKGTHWPCRRINVGFNYKKPTSFSVDETAVRGHWRWQPCGEKRSNVKLTWVRDHIRKYSKNDLARESLQVNPPTIE